MQAQHRADCEALNTIASLLIDEVTLGTRAAERASDSAARARLESTLAERRRLLADVQARVRTLRCKPTHKGTLMGAAQKALTGLRPDTALHQVERDERHVRDAIRKCMRRENLTAETRAFLGVALDRLVTSDSAAAPGSKIAALELA